MKTFLWKLLSMISSLRDSGLGRLGDILKRPVENLSRKLRELHEFSNGSRRRATPYRALQQFPYFAAESVLLVLQRHDRNHGRGAQGGI
jgi:hypothetical protein